MITKDSKGSIFLRTLLSIVQTIKLLKVYKNSIPSSTGSEIFSKPSSVIMSTNA